MKRLTVAVVAVVLTLGMLPGPARAVEPVAVTPATAHLGVPVLAYFYNWFDAGSWNRAKIDYPAIGQYSSDDPRVIRTQIHEAQSAGIDGFIVSWKSSVTNNRRLRLLITIAREEHFKLAMIYQGLDFARNPQPAARVAADFQLFRDSFASDPVFVRIAGKPLTIFSGTWAFDHDGVAAITGPVRTSMNVLSTEKSLKGYERLADVTDGDAYYWSSVDPDTHPNYPDKLLGMGEAIHADGKIWIAPFSPGFDARLVGGTKSVDRKDGDTLVSQFQAAARSSPDAYGLISWNEYSENTHVEPSQAFGDRYLGVLRTLLTTPTPAPSASDAGDMADSSSSPPGDPGDFVANVTLLIIFVVGLLSVVGFLAWRRRRRDSWPPLPTADNHTHDSLKDSVGPVR